MYRTILSLARVIHIASSPKSRDRVKNHVHQKGEDKNRSNVGKNGNNDLLRRIIEEKINLGKDSWIHSSKELTRTILQLNHSDLVTTSKQNLS